MICALMSFTGFRTINTGGWIPTTAETSWDLYLRIGPRITKGRRSWIVVRESKVDV